ncbi:MAG: S8 family serine peptidase [Phycisphaerales bacterium]|nr:S8 family serine peptidase [Phycisphaerales bacterium]MCI0630653.1 S8 family serine peptidase [Phycisphaerales bacterium]MCI0676690.1 S8 family serine peptidase [Phycisphaerales bacterium]
MRLERMVGRVGVGVGLVVALGLASSVGAQQAAPPLVRYVQGKAIELPLDTSRLVVFMNDDADGEVTRHALAPLGFRAQDVQPYGVEGWNYVRTPPDVDVRAEVEGLAAQVAAAVDFVSPVFFDEYGRPMHATPDVLVRFQPEVGRAVALDTLRAVAPQVIEPEIDWGRMANAYRLRNVGVKGMDVIAVANALAVRHDVRWAEVNWMMTGELYGGLPNDPSFFNCWGHENTGQVLACGACLGWNAPVGVPDMDMDTPEAWAITTGDPSIVVAIFDTGINQTHPDISQVTPGYDFVNQGGDGGPWTNCDTHGTAVAGAVSALINNGIGGVGVAPGARSIAMKIGNQGPDGMGGCNNNFGGYTSAIAVEALDTCQDIGVRVTNHSYSVGSNNSVIDKFNETYAAGIIHFASSGNGGADSIGDPVLPFPANVATVNAVAGLDPDGTLTGFSNFGPGLFISAPGVGVCGTGSCFCGTSASSPSAAGVAALVLSVDPGLTPGQVETILATNAMNLGVPGYDQTYGWGFINAHEAVIDAIGCPGVGSCLDPHETPGCNDGDCCAQVCAFDPFCCNFSWDGACVIHASSICLGCPGDGPCDEAHGGVGCSDPICCFNVCSYDSFCCDPEFGWDAACVAYAIDLCNLSPPNDLCNNATPITEEYTPFSVSNAGNDGVSHFAQCAWNAEFIKDVWFKYTAQCTGFMTVSTCGLANFETWLAVYDGDSACPPGSIPLLACAHDTPGCSNNTATISGIFVTQGDTYRIRVGALIPQQGNGLLQVFCEALFDDCDGAFFLDDFTGNININNRSATTDGPPHFACSGGGNNQITDDVWFDWIAPCTGSVTLQTCGTVNFDTKIAIYSGCACPVFTANLLGCNDNAPNCAGNGSRLTVPVTQGECYKIRVGGVNGDQGSGQLNISCSNAPLNNDCEDAALTFLGIPTPFTTVNATTDGPAHPGCGSTIVNDVWFRRTATCTGFMTVTTCGTADYNTKIAVYDGCDCPVTDNELMACNDNAANCANNGSRVTVPVIQGECYLVRIGAPNIIGDTSGTGSVDFICAETCDGDINIDGFVNVTDMLLLIAAWGPCPACGPTCLADINGDCIVNVDDLLELIANWGNCFPV